MTEHNKIIVNTDFHDITNKVHLKSNDRPYHYMGLLVLFVTFGVGFGWAAYAPLKSSVIAPGQVAVASRNKVVQHLDGGRVKEILVREGDVVNKDEVILRMDDEDLQAQFENYQTQIWESTASQERLTAEQNGIPLTFSKDLQDQSKKSPILLNILKTQKRLFSLGKETLDKGQQVLTQRVKQAKKQISGSRNQLRSLRQQETLLAKDVASLKPLAAKQLIAQNTYRDKLRAYSEIKGDISSREAEISRLNEVITELSQQMGLENKQFLKNSNSELHDLERRHIDLVANKRRLENKLSRITVKAPVSGKIEKFDVVTIGAVVSPGQPILEIVPQDKKFNLIANVSLTDIDAIYMGQEAEIRFPSFDDARFFDPVFANIENIAADSTLNEKANSPPYYKTRLSLPDKTITMLNDNELHLVPGMPANVIIQTGERTVLDYLIKPLRRVLDNTFNEH